MKRSIVVGILAVLAVPSISIASIDVNLKYGSRGAEVAELQEFLITKGLFAGNATGNFFSVTRGAVIAYQRSVALPSTGYVGPMTREKINTELAKDDVAADTAETIETGTSTPPQQESVTDLLKKQNQLLQQQLDAQKVGAAPNPQIITPTVQPLTLTIGQPVCTSSTTSHWSINTDWTKVYQVVIHFNGTTTYMGVEEQQGGGIIYSLPRNKPDVLDWYNRSGTLHYIASAHLQPEVANAWTTDYGKTLLTVEGDMILPHCD